MKRPISRVEKLLVAVPLMGVLLTWQWDTVRHVAYRVFPRRILSREFNSGSELRFSPDGSVLMASSTRTEDKDGTGSKDYTQITAWETSIGMSLFHRVTVRPASDRKLIGMAFSPDNSMALVLDTSYGYGVEEKTPTALSLFDVKTGRLIRSFKTRGVYHARFVDGDRKILCDGEPTRILDAQTGLTLATTAARTSVAQQPQVSADGNTGLVLDKYTDHGQKRERFASWDFRTPRCLRKFPAAGWKNTPTDRTFRLSNDGKYVCTNAFLTPPVELWDVTEGRRLHSLLLPNVLSLYFSPDSRHLIILRARGSTARQWEVQAYDVRTFRKLWTWPDRTNTRDTRWVGSARPSMDGRFVVAVFNNRVRWLDMQNGKEVFQRECGDVVQSPDGKHVAVKTKRTLEIQKVPQ